MQSRHKHYTHIQISHEYTQHKCTLQAHMCKHTHTRAHTHTHTHTHTPSKENFPCALRGSPAVYSWFSQPLITFYSKEVCDQERTGHSLQQHDILVMNVWINCRVFPELMNLYLEFFNSSVWLSSLFSHQHSTNPSNLLSPSLLPPHRNIWFCATAIFRSRSSSIQSVN